MKATQSGSFLAFKEIANKSFGLADDDNIELVPLDSVLAQIEELYSREVSHFDTVVELIRQDELYFTDLGVAVDTFRRHIVQAFGIPDSKAAMLQCAPLEAVVFTSQATSEARRRFCAQYRGNYQFDEQHGYHIFHFMLAHFMEESSNFKRLTRGMRSRLVSYGGSLESVYSIWKTNQFDRVWTLPRDSIPKRAYASATHRLIDGLCSAVGFNGAYELFVKHLNPLEKFPVQFLYNVIMNDPKTIMQEFATANRIALPRYDVCRVGGLDHAPEFRCSLSFRKRTFEGSADSKLGAEAVAARKAVEFLVETDQNRITLWIANTIAAGMHREDTNSKTLEASPSKLVTLQEITGTSCSGGSLVKCLTLKADVLPYSLSLRATNENLAFCGSWLAMAIAAAKSSDKTGSGLSLPASIQDCVKQTRRNVFPRSNHNLSSSQYLDVVQAILYAEFVLRGYVVAAKLFDRCILAFRKGEETTVSGPFLPNVPYTQLLQEVAQEAAHELPIYQYVLTNPKEPHAAIFRCRGSYQSFHSEALGTSKKIARQKVAYQLLKQVEKTKE